MRVGYLFVFLWLSLWLGVAGGDALAAPAGEGESTEVPSAPEAPPAAVAADEAAAPAAATDEAPLPEVTGIVDVHVGSYVNRISGISIKDGMFTVDFWLWFRWNGDYQDFNPVQTFEVTNGSIVSKDSEDYQKLSDGSNYASVRVVVDIFHIFDVSAFPLDDHEVFLQIEDTSYDAKSLRYISDSKNAGVDPSAVISGWALSSGTPNVTEWAYSTNYGNVDLGADDASSYSRYRHPLEFTRRGGGMYFKLFWGSHMAVILAFSALLIKVTDLDARFGLGVGSLFAAVANAYIIADALPDVDMFALGDQVNLLAALFIFLSIVVSVFSLRLTYEDREDDSRKMDYRAAAILFSAWLVCNTLILLNVYQS